MLLVAILAAGAALRLWNYDFDVGTRFIHDADHKIAQAELVATGDLVPRNWVQPYFLPYSTGGVLAAVSLFRDLDPATSERAITLTFIFLSLATVAFGYLLAVTASGRRRIALVTAGILAVAPVTVTGSRYIKEDVPVALWCQVALLFFLLIVRYGKARHYVGGGLAAGVAIGTKLSALTLLPVLLTAHVVGRRSRTGVEPRPGGLRVLGTLLLVGVGFVLVNPFILVHFSEVLGGVAYQAGYSERGHHDGTVFDPWALGWTLYLRYAIAPGLTVPICSAFLIGMALALGGWRRTDPQSRSVLLLASWVAVMYLAFESSPAKPFPFFARYLHPIYPAAAVLAAVALWRGRELVRARLPRLTWLANLTMALVLAWPAATSVLVTAAIAVDTRTQAAHWMLENLPAGAKVALDDPYYSPPLDQPPFDTRGFEVRSALRLSDRGPLWLGKARVDYIVTNSFRTDRYLVARHGSSAAEEAFQFYEVLRASWPVVARFRPRWSIQTYGFHNPVITIHRRPARLE